MVCIADLKQIRSDPHVWIESGAQKMFYCDLAAIIDVCGCKGKAQE